VVSDASFVDQRRTRHVSVFDVAVPVFEEIRGAGARKIRRGKLLDLGRLGVEEFFRNGVLAVGEEVDVNDVLVFIVSGREAELT
jgi:hypothetical protein